MKRVIKVDINKINAIEAKSNPLFPVPDVDANPAKRNKRISKKTLPYFVFFYKTKLSKLPMFNE